MNKKKVIIFAAIAMFVLALGLTLYPLLANLYNEKHQSMILDDYREQIAQADNSMIIEAKELAIAYNESIQPGVQSQEAFSSEALTDASVNYETLLDLTGTGIMGYVKIPSISVTLPIYHGTDIATLEIGIGHLLGSSLPVGGKGTHTVLTAHSGMASKKMFSDLDLLKEGDVFYLDVLDERLAYQVDAINTVLPYDTTHLGIESGEDYCTLVTCTPFAINTHRLLVRGTRIDYDAAEEIEEQLAEEEPTESTWEEKYMDGIVSGICLVLIILIIVGVVCYIRRD